MTVRNLMADYTAYTDAQELTAMRGTHRDIVVTPTDTGITSTFMANAFHDFADPENAPVRVTSRQVD